MAKITCFFDSNLAKINEKYSQFFAKISNIFVMFLHFEKTMQGFL